MKSSMGISGVVGLALLALVAVALSYAPRDIVAQDAGRVAVVPPTVWMGEPSVVSSRIEVDPPEFLQNETGYTQTMRYRQIVEYEVTAGIGIQ